MNQFDKSIELSEHFQRVLDYAKRNNIEFPHHFGEFLDNMFKEIYENIDAMKQGCEIRIADLEQQIDRIINKLQ